MPDMEFVESSSIEAIGYDAETLELHVRFLRSGELYVYYGVEDWRYTELMQSDSKGAYLNTQIKPFYEVSQL